MSFFEDRGFEVDTLDFPGRSSLALRRQTLALSDYREHLVQKIQGFATPPILIAHSLGGLIAQQAMYLAPVSAVALLSPIPPDGILRSMLALTRRSPLSTVKMLVAIADARVTRLAAAPSGMFSETSDPKGIVEMTAELRSESLLAITQSLRQPLPDKKAPAPIHFWGATGDFIIPAKEVERAARFYDAPVTIYEGMSHAFQVEKDWRRIASDIFAWLEKQNLTGTTAEARG